MNDYLKWVKKMNLNEEKELSIIVPHYNSPKLLERLLYSIPKDVEVLVVDDKSTEGLPDYEIVKNKFNHIKFYDNKSDKKGAGVCRNIGIKNATGKWILFADADDYFTEGFYDVVGQYFDAKDDLIYFVPSSIDEITGDTSHRHVHYENIIQNYLNKPSQQSELALRYEFPSPLSKLIKRSLIIDNKILFDETCVSEDYIFSTKVGYFAKRFLVSDKTIYIFTESHGSLSKQMSCVKYMVHVQAFVNVYQFLNFHLSKKEMKMLDLAGIGFLFYGLKHRIKATTLFKAFNLIRKNTIPLFKRKYKNPFIMWRLLILHLSIYHKEKKYYVKE